jgi:hypothetical protein
MGPDRDRVDKGTYQLWEAPYDGDSLQLKQGGVIERQVILNGTRDVDSAPNQLRLVSASYIYQS